MKPTLSLFFLFFFATAFSQLTKLNTTLKFQFVEGPAWDGKGALYFSDMNAKKVYKYVPATGFSTIRSGQVTNGMAFDSTGFLIVCEQGPTNQLVKMDTLGKVKSVLVNKYNNKAFNNPNDLCIDNKGGIYFSDPTWGTQTQDKQAVYYLKPSGDVIRISGDFKKPNGVCLSPDQKLLYVDDSNDKNVWVFDVQPDGTAINKRVFCVIKLANGSTSNADGMKVDAEGNLYVTSAAGIQQFDKNGKSIRIIAVPEGPTNVAFGGADWKTLFITAGTSLYSMQVEIPGIPIYTAVPEWKTSKLKCYPNPCSGMLHLGLETYRSVKVYSSFGQEVLSPQASGIIDLSHLPNGWYLVQVDDGKTINSAKVLLQN